MKRALAAVAACAAVLASAASASTAAVRIAGIDTSGYPTIALNVVTAHPTTRAPRLTEDGRAVTGYTAVNFDSAKSVVLAIDDSRSMQGTSLDNAVAAAEAFVERKAPGDRISVIAFGRHERQLTGFSTAPSDAVGVLSGLTVDSQQGTALYDGVVAAANELRGSQLAGRVIVLLTDGRDVSSSSSLSQAVAAARDADASIYSIGIESRDFDPSALRALAQSTNGTYYGADAHDSLTQIYGAIAAELQRTWRISYDTTARPGDTVQLHVSAPGAGAAATSLQLAPSLGGGASAPSAGSLPSFAYSPAGTLALAGIVGLLVLLAVLALTHVRRGGWVKQRLEAHVGHARRQSSARGERLSFMAAIFKATEGALGRRSQWRSVEKLLVRGDVPLRPAEFLWTMIGGSVGFGLLFAIFGAPAVLILVAMVAGAFAPYWFVSLRVRRRAKAFENQLPDLLTTIAASLKAGHSFKHGLQAVLDESAPPASIELKRVLTEAGLGRPMDDALTEMADRVASKNFEFAITAVTIQRQVGGSLATLFDMVSETVRNRQQFARKIRSLTAMGRMSAYTLIGIPFFITGMISLTNKSYMNPLFHTHLGHMMLIVGLVMMGIGSMILKKIVSFRG